MQQALLEMTTEIKREFFNLMIMIAPIALVIFGVSLVWKKLLYWFYDVTGVGNIIKINYVHRINSLYEQQKKAPDFMRSYYKKRIYEAQRQYYNSTVYDYKYTDAVKRYR